MKTDISVIIPVYNGAKTIEDCLTSVLRAPPLAKKTIVVDNNSNDNTRKIVRRFKNVKLLIEKKRGPAAARNKGLKETNCEIAIFVDADVIVKRNTFIDLLKHIRARSIAGVGGIAESYDRHNSISLSQDIRLFGNSVFDTKVKKVNHIPTMIVAYRTKIIKELGYFNEDYYPSGEDVDLNYRIRKAKYTLLISPLSRVYHNHPISIKGLINKWFHYGVGWAKLCMEHNKYFALSSSILWIVAVFILFISFFVKKGLLPAFLLVLMLPWVIYYSIPTLKYLVIKRDARAFLFPFIHQIQIFARSIGVLYGALIGSLGF